MTCKTNNHNNKVIQLEMMISRLLQIGIAVSAFIIFIGLVLYLITGNGGYPGNAYPKSEGEIVKGLLVFKPFAIILSGLFLLILTPVFRVVISIFVFFWEKDYLYVLITVIVFIVLLIGFLLGKAFG